MLCCIGNSTTLASLISKLSVILEIPMSATESGKTTLLIYSSLIFLTVLYEYTPRLNYARE